MPRIFPEDKDILKEEYNDIFAEKNVLTYPKRTITVVTDFKLATALKIKPGRQRAPY